MYLPIFADINDVASEIPDIATIHNGRVFEVIQGLTWNEQVFVLNSTNTLIWTMFVDGKQQATGTVDLNDSRQLPSEINAGNATVSSSGTHTIEVVVVLDDVETIGSRQYQSFNKGVSFAPLVVVLVFAMTTHMVELSLGLGVFVGACMVTGTVTVRPPLRFSVSWLLTILSLPFITFSLNFFPPFLVLLVFIYYMYAGWL